MINDHSNDEDHEESEQMTNGRHLPKKFFFFGCASGAGEFMMKVEKNDIIGNFRMKWMIMI